MSDFNFPYFLFSLVCLTYLFHNCGPDFSRSEADRIAELTRVIEQMHQDIHYCAPETPPHIVR